MEEKKTLRRIARAQRKIYNTEHPSASEAIATNAMQWLAEHPSQGPVAAYWSMGHEVSMAPLLNQLHTAGVTCCLPVVVIKHQALAFRRWMPDIQLVAGPFSTQHPPESQPICLPQALFVPLLSFDRQCNRLGYGGGHYDRTLETLRAHEPNVQAIGVAFAGQEVKNVPTEPTDQRLDAIITDQEIILPENRIIPT